MCRLEHLSSSRSGGSINSSRCTGNSGGGGIYYSIYCKLGALYCTALGNETHGQNQGLLHCSEHQGQLCLHWQHVWIQVRVPQTCWLCKFFSDAGCDCFHVMGKAMNFCMFFFFFADLTRPEMFQLSFWETFFSMVLSYSWATSIKLRNTFKYTQYNILLYSRAVATIRNKTLHHNCWSESKEFETQWLAVSWGNTKLTYFTTFLCPHSCTPIFFSTNPHYSSAFLICLSWWFSQEVFMTVQVFEMLNLTIT